ncbi:MAG TPA: hypothetical protein VMT20_03190 [Terriglobia bacterium]|nr:hypothetical protein [Terriglobia bacterium]
MRATTQRHSPTFMTLAAAITILLAPLISSAQGPCPEASLSTYLAKGFTCTVGAQTFSRFLVGGFLGLTGKATTVTVIPARGFAFDLTKVKFPAGRVSTARIVYTSTPFPGATAELSGRGVTTPNVFVDEGIFPVGFTPIELKLRTAAGQPVFNAESTPLAGIGPTAFDVVLDISTKGPITGAYGTFFFDPPPAVERAALPDQAACAPDSLAAYVAKGFTCTLGTRVLLSFKAGGDLGAQAASILVIPTAAGDGFDFDLTGVTFPPSALGGITYVVTGLTAGLTLQFDPTSPPGMVRVRASTAPVGGPLTYFAGTLVENSGPSSGPGSTTVSGAFAAAQNTFQVTDSLLITSGGTINSFSVTFQ